MRILVFGETGQVARALAPLLPKDAVCLNRAQADLLDPAACAAAIHSHAPDVVINAAAWTAVDKAEGEETDALTVNALAPGAMAAACASRGIPFLHVSTDYVFDGSGDAPWQTDAPTAPLNAYGRTKLAGEQAIRAAGGRAAILRTSWVFSTHGANFLKTMLRLSETRDALSIVDDQIGGPTPAEAIARALITMAEALFNGHPGGTWHIAGTPFVSWADFAREIFAAADRSVTVTGIPTADYPTPAPRPLNSRLDGTTLLRDFGLPQPDWKAQTRADVRRLIP
ncbi:dTDP-4-dehydrorhamnose reductase [Pararhodobacter zhoushanensis]|uniref:dTDP-4-dehydrorhamnose reductase n=1 Tax=Pararhodobacter zhoushanensis TaxID=2479545 RepID=A0ABT3H2C8_9RHOB|nr:dTDP-4-dehydrorhamnose reductase [Pararhodobacter zhoushanensis]MCW1933936.1 dTDP-4-dehydrorhamnose reductase [Pararhodobacter zhoushanensis]